MATGQNQTFHAGLTPERVVDAAVELTRESHLLTWSIRDLAARLGVAPSVVYHHVGGKDLLCRRVVERFLGRIEFPAESLAWQDWFRRFLGGLGPLAVQYPGVAKWMLMHGPVITAAHPVLEAGLRVLRAAGFGAHGNAALALLLNNAMLTVGIGDDRLQHEGDGPRDHATMMTGFSDDGVSDDLRAMRREFVGGFAAGGASGERMRADYFGLVVETTIAGLEVVLAPEGRHLSA